MISELLNFTNFLYSLLLCLCYKLYLLPSNPSKFIKWPAAQEELKDLVKA